MDQLGPFRFSQWRAKATDPDTKIIFEGAVHQLQQIGCSCDPDMAVSGDWEGDVFVPSALHFSHDAGCSGGNAMPQTMSPVRTA